ncbi:MAG TPA: hypothetical protein VL993_04240 [Stellaceae bacterium]|nr:hypothetical protein [Stellaceae bacterium]
MTFVTYATWNRTARLGALAAGLLALSACVYTPVSPPPSEYGYYNGYYYGSGYYTPNPLIVGSLDFGGYWGGRGYRGHWNGGHWHGGGHWRR